MASAADRSFLDQLNSLGTELYPRRSHESSLDPEWKYRIYAELERRGLHDLARYYAKKNFLRPFTERIRNYVDYVAPDVDKMFSKMITKITYDGHDDPIDHVYFFHDMSIMGVSDDMLCRAFPVTLTGNARKWFSTLKPNSIDSFHEISKRFCNHFIGRRMPINTFEGLGELERRGLHTLTRDYVDENFLSPFTERIRKHVAPDGFKMVAKMVAKITYDGENDPIDHVYAFHDMGILGVSDEMLCQAFPATLRGNARKWFSTLKPNSIDSFHEIGKRFYNNFRGSCRPSNTFEGLDDFVQKRNESLRDYFQRFHSYAVDVEGLTAATASFHLSKGTTSMMLISELGKTKAATLADVFCIACKVIDTEEQMMAFGAAPQVVKRTIENSCDRRPGKRRKNSCRRFKY